jgi:hypothetical protein
MTCAISVARVARLAFAAAALWLAACVQLPPTPQDVQAKQFRNLPDRAVIYLVRDVVDFNSDPATVVLDQVATLTTYPGTYYRWEVAPGRHRIAGFAGDSGVMILDVDAGGIYFVQQTVSRLFFGITTQSYFRPVDDGYGRAVVMRSKLIGS